MFETRPFHWLGLQNMRSATETTKHERRIAAIVVIWFRAYLLFDVEKKLIPTDHNASWNRIPL